MTYNTLNTTSYRRVCIKSNDLFYDRLTGNPIYTLAETGPANSTYKIRYFTNYLKPYVRQLTSLKEKYSV